MRAVEKEFEIEHGTFGKRSTKASINVPENATEWIQVFGNEPDVYTWFANVFVSRAATSAKQSANKDKLSEAQTVEAFEELVNNVGRSFTGYKPEAGGLSVREIKERYNEVRTSAAGKKITEMSEDEKNELLAKLGIGV